MDVVYVNAARDDAFLSHLNAKKEKFANHLTYSAIPDNYDKVLISHISRIFKRGQVSNPTSSVKNPSV